MNTKTKWVLAVMLGGAVAAFTTGCASTASERPGPRYSSKPWLPMTNLEKKDDFKRLPDDAQIAMACAKCKSVIVSTKRELSTKPGRGTVEEFMTVDQCPGCGGKMVVRADKQTEMVHTCSKCGDDSAFCCATHLGDKPTKGMERSNH